MSYLDWKLLTNDFLCPTESNPSYVNPEDGKIMFVLTTAESSTFLTDQWAYWKWCWWWLDDDVGWHWAGAVSCRTWLHKHGERSGGPRVHVGFPAQIDLFSRSLFHFFKAAAANQESDLIVSSSLVPAESCCPKVKLLWPIRAEPRRPVQV